MGQMRIVLILKNRDKFFYDDVMQVVFSIFFSFLLLPSL